MPEYRMTEKKFNQKKFRELLKKGIGLRTQKQFAEQTGIAHATINRMLNDDTISCPRIKTLEVFANNMQNVTLPELLEACGYSVPSIEETVAKMESDISDFFEFSDRIDWYDNLEELTQRLAKFLGIQRSDISHEEYPESISKEYLGKGAENARIISVKWKYGRLECDTRFCIYYVLTKSDRVLLIGTDIHEVNPNPEEGQIQHTIINKIASPAEKRLLECIFGITNSDSYAPTTRQGYGFEIKGMPKGFLDFLNQHADTFCDSAENAKLYKKIIQGEEPEKVFDDYSCNNSDIGPCAVIADIMTKETGMDFIYLDTDFNLPDEMQNSCIMVSSESKIGYTKPLNHQLVNYLYECAKLLKIQKFGMVYYHYAYPNNQEYQFDINTFGM